MILLDTDVVLDLALGREPWADTAQALFDALAARPKSAFVAWHTISNAFYLLAPSVPGADPRRFLAELTEVAAVVPTGSEDVRWAAGLPMGDFEDALQVAAARTCGARWIVTRNGPDYDRSPIPAITPAEALELLAKA